MNWFLVALRKSFTYQGRARRREYGWFLLIFGLISFTFSFLVGAAEMLNLLPLANALNLVSMIISTVFVIPMINVTTRRLHDLDLSGWWQAGILLVTLVAVFVFVMWLTPLFITMNPNANAEYVGGVIGGIIGFSLPTLFNLWLIFKDGQKHPNKYGESPKYPSENADTVVSKTV